MIVLSHADASSILRFRYSRGCIAVLDKDYNVATDGAFEAFLKELWEVLRVEYGVDGDKWEPFFDCDNFALEAIRLAYMKHRIARRAGAGSAQGVAFGFAIVPEIAHAVFFRIGPDRKVHEYHGQNGKPIVLTPSQCASVSLAFMC